MTILGLCKGLGADMGLIIGYCLDFKCNFCKFCRFLSEKLTKIEKIENLTSFSKLLNFSMGENMI